MTTNKLPGNGPGSQLSDAEKLNNSTVALRTGDRVRHPSLTRAGTVMKAGKLALVKLDSGQIVSYPTEMLRPVVDDGAELLRRIAGFLGRFVAYPSGDARVAHALWIAHTHLLDCFESTPRIAFLSPEPGSGKTRALELSELLVPRPVMSVNATPAYLFRIVADQGNRATILFDEIDALFGPRAREHEEVRGLLNAGHRRGATAGRCVVKGKQIFTEELPAYAAVALAG